MSNFITNQKDQKTLAGRLRSLVEHSAELKFLVGYFYFSGWGELYESIKGRDDITIKLLVGLDVDELLGKTIEHGNVPDGLSKDEKADDFFKSLNFAINNEQTDTEEFYKQVKYFLELIEAGRLEIRKTLEPNHAKLYLFKFQGALQSIQGGRFITGSSNLTHAGLRGQNEFNVEIGDYGTQEAEEYFDKLWQSGVEITADDVNRRRLMEFIKHNSQAADVTPFEAYVLMLKTYLEVQELKQIKPLVDTLMTKHGYTPYSYQKDAVSQALSILDSYNGVIVADVVGLGKSVIASLIAASLGCRGLIICPPGLMGHQNGHLGGWHKYRLDFELSQWEIRSCGQLEETLEFVKSPQGSDIEAVIIDEAHRFRNQDTEAYELLSHICRGKKVILLTATPFNNSPADIFSMLKLFTVPGQSGLTLEDDLEGKFALFNALFRDYSIITRFHNDADHEKQMKAAQLYEKYFEELPMDINKVKQASHMLAAQIRALLEPVLIRRNRIDLKNDHIYSKEVTEISETKDPIELFFELDRSQSHFYQEVIEKYFGDGGEFKGAVYQPFNYEGKSTGSEVQDGFFRTSQRNLFDFMRRLLVKRFESSFGAFYESIERFLKLHENVQKFIRKSGGKYVLDRKLIETMYEADESDVMTALGEFAEELEKDDEHHDHEKVYEIDKFKLKDQFLADIESDRLLFSTLKNMLNSFGLVENDPKREKLVEELKKILAVKETPKRKVIVFTEYVDTVKHLRATLEKEFPGQVLSASEYGLTGGDIKKIYSNFDASVADDKQQDDFQILLASDKLSEGFNLNRAGAIINYDIPWNPTRVIQRVGRINRIGKKVFDLLYIYNFFPTEQGASIVQSREIASQKMFLIHNILGEDSKIFDTDEEPSAADLFKRINQNPSELENESLLTSVRNKMDDISKKYPDVISKIKNFPARVKTAKRFDKNQLIVLQKKALGLFVQFVDNTEQENPFVNDILFEDMLQLVRCEYTEPILELSERFWQIYEKVKTYRPILRRASSENAVEVKASNVLNCVNRYHSIAVGDILKFVQDLIKDIKAYRTLPKYTLRMIANSNISEKSSADKIAKFVGDIKNLRRIIGADYLKDVEKVAKAHKNTIIIAIENII